MSSVLLLLLTVSGLAHAGWFDRNTYRANTYRARTNTIRYEANTYRARTNTVRYQANTYRGRNTYRSGSQGTPGDLYPPGTYQKNCEKFALTGKSTLTASCADNQGVIQESSLYFGNCRNLIGVSNGKLTCGVAGAKTMTMPDAAPANPGYDRPASPPAHGESAR